jgi:hypothetical protein
MSETVVTRCHEPAKEAMSLDRLGQDGVPAVLPVRDGYDIGIGMAAHCFLWADNVPVRMRQSTMLMMHNSGQLKLPTSEGTAGQCIVRFEGVSRRIGSTLVETCALQAKVLGYSLTLFLPAPPHDQVHG